VSGVPKTLSAHINTNVTETTTSVSERRTFFRPTRDPWNPHIYQLLKYIDKLQEFYLSTGDVFYEEQSIVVRKLVLDLKKKIHYNESVETGD
jgi:hypothetical protein